MRPRARDGEPSLIVSLTTFPARVADVWVTLESLLVQSLAPDRIVIALSEEEFPGRRLPPALAGMSSRGVEVLWVPENTRSYKKLAPALIHFPDAVVVTVDDDAEYDASMLEQLVDAARSNPGHVIGHKGWEVPAAADRLVPYVDWSPAWPASPPDRTFLTGVGGVLYPPGLRSKPDLSDSVTALRVCPSNDDIWFWAANRAAGVPSLCLGNIPYAPVELTLFSPALGDENSHANDGQIAAAVAHFAARGQDILPSWID